MNVRLSLASGFDINIYWDGVKVIIDETALSIPETRIVIAALTEITNAQENN